MLNAQVRKTPQIHCATNNKHSYGFLWSPRTYVPMHVGTEHIACVIRFACGSLQAVGLLT